MSHRAFSLEADADPHQKHAHFRIGETVLYRDPLLRRDVLTEFRAVEGDVAVVRYHDQLYRVPVDWIQKTFGIDLPKR
jgi:hypothetical protein